MLIAIDMSPSVATAPALADAQAAAAQILEAANGRAVGLIVFAGEAYDVAAPTADPETLETQIAVLGPKTMPGKGSRPAAALALARQMLAGGADADLVLITDGGGVDATAFAEARRLADSGVRLSLLTLEDAAGPGNARNDAAARERFLSIMEREAERMNRLVSDLLSLSRVESEERMRPSDRVDVVALLQSAVVTLRPMAEEAGVTLAVTGHDRPVEVQGDADQLVQVFTNLIENAIKYGASGGKVEVRVAHSERELAFRGPGIRIDIQDWGEGFDPVHIPRLTERFYRVDGQKSGPKEGTGLGLAIVKHIVNRHRGGFTVESAPGAGSVFSVFLPVPAAAREAAVETLH